jgi:hypothetical protein
MAPRSGATPRDHRVLPDRIILVRHAESEGNVNNEAYTYTPDSQVPLVSPCCTRRKPWLCLAGGRATTAKEGCTAV